MLQRHSLLTRIDVKLSDAAQHIIQYIYISCYREYCWQAGNVILFIIITFRSNDVICRNHNNNAINKQYNDMYSIIFLQTN